MLPRVLLALTAAAGCAGTVASESRPPGSAEFADPSWDDGMAVVLTYRGRVRRYGVWRDAVVRDYLVREYVDPADLTKRDVPRPDLVPVLKANRVAEFDTGSYGYRLASSLFFRRSDGALVKGVGSCLNACGIVFHRWDAPSGTIRTDSYWEEEGRAEAPLPPAAGVRFGDELPHVVRGLADGAEVRVLPPLASPRSILQPLGPDGDAAKAQSWLGVGDVCEECADLGAAPHAARGAAALATVTLHVRRDGATTRLVGGDGAVKAEFVHDAGGFLEAWTLPGEQEFRRVRWFRGPYWQRTARADRELADFR